MIIAPIGEVAFHNDVNLRVYIASNPYTQAVGLSTLEHLETDGMLFVLSELSSSPITMINCAIPLDLAWFGDDGVCLDTRAMVPHETIANPPQPYRYALEVYAGCLNEHEIRIGSQILYYSEENHA